MSNNCKYYISNKKRFCLKKSNMSSYCKIHEKIINKTETSNQLGAGSQLDVPQLVSPYMLTSSKLPVNPQQQSWYHYQAPVYQNFGDYVCIKKSYLNTTRDLLHDLLGSTKIK